MTSILKLLVATSTISVAALGANPAFAADLGTDAGTSITNNVSVAYNVGGTAQTAETDSDVFVVDRQVNLVITKSDSVNTKVAPNATQQAVTYVVSNQTNDTIDVLLTSEQLGTDDFDVAGTITYYLDDGTTAGVFDAGDTLITYIDNLAEDTSVTVHAVANIPTSVVTGDLADVILIGQQIQVGNYVAATKPTLVRSSDGKVVKQTALPSFSERAEVRFTPDQTGFYTLEVDVGANAFILLEASVPVAIDTTKKAVGLIASTGSLFAQVPKGTEVFAFGVAGEGCEEAVHATVIDPSGKPVWTRDNITQMERFTSKKDSTMASGLWQINFEKPIQNVFEDYYVEVLGVPGYLFLNRERYWSF